MRLTRHSRNRRDDFSDSLLGYAVLESSIKSIDLMLRSTGCQCIRAGYCAA